MKKKQPYKQSNTPLKRLMATDPSKLTDKELVYLILSTVKPASKAEKTTDRLFEKYADLGQICALSPEALEKTKGVGPKGMIALRSALAMCFNISKVNLAGDRPRAYTKEDGYKFFAPRFIGKRVEHMFLMLIDSKERVMAVEEISVGNVDKLTVDPKQVVDFVSKYNAKKAVLAHNHFSGLAPSVNDVVLTSKLVWLLGHLKVELCDHLIFCDNMHHSMVEAGEMTPITYNLIFGEELSL